MNIFTPQTRNMADQGLDDFSPWTASPKGVSRLYNEFEVLQFVGKGAFGDVLKVIQCVCLITRSIISINQSIKISIVHNFYLFKINQSTTT